MSPPAWAGARSSISADGSYMTTALGRHAAQREGCQAGRSAAFQRAITRSRSRSRWPLINSTYVGVSHCDNVFHESLLCTDDRSSGRASRFNICRRIH